MELIQVTSQNFQLYTQFVDKRYQDNPLTRASQTGLLKQILKGKSQICKSLIYKAYVIKEDNQVIMSATLALVDRLPDTLQIAFFESTSKNHKAFDLIYDLALDMAKHHGCRYISAGLNLHVNYGLGYLFNQYDKKQSFGMAYNAPFYHDYFLEKAFDPINLVAYKKDMASFDLPFSERLIKRVKSQYTVRKANFKNIKDEAHIYTIINNQAFSDHIFYYTRKPEEDIELFKDFRHLLKEDNLLFVEKGGQPVGFMLWYPDFHELMANKEKMGLKTVIKTKLNHHKMTTFKIVEMGVIPSEQKHGAILGLFDTLNTLVKGKYTWCESGWILEDNTDSSNFGLKWSGDPYKRYKAYIKDLSYD